MAKPEPSIFDQPEDAEADAKRLAEAEADIAAGRLVPHEEVAKWLDTWGKPDRKPPPRPWLK